MDDEVGCLVILASVPMPNGRQKVVTLLREWNFKFADCELVVKRYKEAAPHTDIHGKWVCERPIW